MQLSWDPCTHPLTCTGWVHIWSCRTTACLSGSHSEDRSSYDCWSSTYRHTEKHLHFILVHCHNSSPTGIKWLNFKPCMQCILSNHLCLQCVCPCNVLGPTHPLTHLHWLVPQWVISHQSLSFWFSQRGQEHVLAMEFHLHACRNRDKHLYLYSIFLSMQDLH